MILSEGVRRTGAIQRIQSAVSSYTGENVHKQLGATVGLVGPLSGLINNTAAVAILLPMVSDLAHENRTSPSKLLLPLSYASMAGGMLTLIGTSTNLLASSISGELIGQPFSMFEFTHLGLLVFATCALYLLTLGFWLTPAHVRPRSQRESTDWRTTRTSSWRESSISSSSGTRSCRSRWWAWPRSTCCPSWWRRSRGSSRSGDSDRFRRCDETIAAQDCPDA